MEDSSSKNYRFFKSGEDQETCGGDLDFSLVSLPGTLLLRMRRHGEQHQWPTPCPALPFKHPHRSTGTRLGFSAATTNLDSVLCEDMGELAEGKINYERKKVLGEVGRGLKVAPRPPTLPLKWWGSRTCDNIQRCILSIQLI